MRKKIKEIYEKYNMAIMLIFIIIFFIMALLLETNVVSSIDNFIYKYVSLLISSNMTTFFRIITSFGSFYAITSICLLSLIILKSKRNSRLITANAVTIVIISTILKYIFLRERPIDINIITEFGYSFPSNHASVSAAFYGFLAYLAYKEMDNVKKRNIIIIGFGLLVFLIGLSRIYLGVHYASDVLAGYSLSASYLIIFTQFVYKKKR